MKGKKSLRLVAFLLFGLACALWTTIFLYSQNTLFLNDQWLVTKRLAEMGVGGGDEFLLTRQALAGNVLHLEPWYNFQEVYSRRAGPFLSARFRFKIPPRSFLSFTFNRTADSLDGFLLSTTAGDSASFRGTPAGRIISRKPLPDLVTVPGWHEAQIEKTPEGWSLRIDGGPAATVSGTTLSGPIGFRGGFTGADIDDVAVEAGVGKGWKETFSNSRGWAPALASIALALLLAGGLGRRRSLDRLATASATAIAVGSLWLPFDFYYWSYLPSQELFRGLDFTTQKMPRNYPEAMRLAFFGLWNRALGGEALAHEAIGRRGYPLSRIWAGPVYCGALTKGQCKPADPSFMNQLRKTPKASPRLVFIGTSQTIGAGARNLDETFFARLHKGLGTESLNLGASGWLAPILFQRYQSEYEWLSPDLMVINLGFNDSLDSLRKGLRGFLELNRRRGTRTVLIREPISDPIHISSIDGSTIDARHEALAALGREFGVPVLALDEFLASASVQMSGFLWLDYVHLTPYGQELAAQWLEPRLKQELR